MLGVEDGSTTGTPSAPSHPSGASPSKGSVLQFLALQSKVEQGFWEKLSSLKLNELGIDDSPISITGYFAPCSNEQVPENLCLLAESLTAESNTGKSRNRCPVPGTLYNTNTLEGFQNLDRGKLMKMEARKMLEDIFSGKAEEEPAVLSRFLLISFADLKKWKFYYWFAFPALVLDPPAALISLQPASCFFNKEESESLKEACNTWRNSGFTSGVPFFLVTVSSDSHATLRPLRDWKNCKGRDHKLLFGFYDPCHDLKYPGWPLRNFITFISLRWNIENIPFFCYRETHGLPDLALSLVGEASVQVPQEWSNADCVPKVVGWELNSKRKLAPRCISLAESNDPTRLAISAADLNLKLMRWRTLPLLDLSALSSVKCLLLGAGTLGCQVARMLMAWGVRKITLVDNGRVSMSNPLRQSLYTFYNCLNGGDLKAEAAARCLKSIFPAVEAEGIPLSIPMPGHPVSAQETTAILEDCKHLHSLIASHDVIFLLTDTRESRWLPSLLCAESSKIAITAALGFDSYLVMRHGAGPLSSDSDETAKLNTRADDENVMAAQMKKLSTRDGTTRQRLGCYFCNDVVAPIDSTANRTLDQQCTVTRPGLAPIASSLAVELLVGILHHQDGVNAPGEVANSIVDDIERPLGILPHQIRGSIPKFSQLTLIGYSSNSCTACSSTVVSEYRKRGADFILQAINHPTYLEDITGLTDLMNSASSFEVDWENDSDDGI